MSLSSSDLRKAWKACEDAPDRMSEISIGPKTVRIATEAADAWHALNTVLEAHGYKVRPADTEAYANREDQDSDGKSLRAYGIALDLNGSTNPAKSDPDSPVRFSPRPTQEERAADVRSGSADTDMTRQMIDDILAIRTASGQRIFDWGGDWKSKIDTMRFAIAVRPADLADGINLATVRHGGEAGTVISPAAEANLQPAAEPDMPDVGDARPVWSDGFLAAHQAIEKWEGGFVFHPEDPGGATNFGITRSVLESWRGRPVSVEDVRTMTIDEARRIFFVRYWQPLRGDDVPWPLALMTYNAGVNTGPRRGGKFLQRTLNSLGANLKIDGRIGKRTIAAASDVAVDQAVTDFSAILDAYYRGLHHFPTFGKGWLNRLRDITAIALNKNPTRSDTGSIDAPVLDNALRFANSGSVTGSGKGSGEGRIASAGNATPARTDPPDNPAAQPTDTENLSAIDTLLGGRLFVGKKTLIAGFALVATVVLKQIMGDDFTNEMETTLLTIIGTYGGLGAIAKVERAAKNS